MTRKAAVLFAATSATRGSSFLFIRVAVEHILPPAVVFGRTVLGAAFPLPLAIRARAFRGLRRAVLPVLAVTALDMALPTLLLMTVVSGLAFLGPAAADLPASPPPWPASWPLPPSALSIQAWPTGRSTC